MGELGGFLKVHRVGFDKRDPHARVHDYKHDCTLFQSFRQFKHHAVGINRYIKDWGASGFRSRHDL